MMHPEVYPYANQDAHQEGHDFNRVEWGELPPRFTPFTLSELAWKTLSMVEPEAEAKSLQLSVVIDEKVPGTVLGDPEKIQQILFNLLSTVVKFTDRGNITLRTGLGTSGRICFVVEDTGVWNTSVQKKIFRPFSQEDINRDRTLDDIGESFVNARRLLEKMGSILMVKNEEGKGNLLSFDLDLPNAESSNRTGAVDGYDLTILYNGFAKRFPMRILAVEDNAINLKLLVILLGKLGYKEILTATNGEGALAILDHEKVDLIFMDLQMPGIDGLEATRHIRFKETESHSGRPVRIVAVTANQSASVRKECFSAGMDHYVSKPFNVRTLADAIFVGKVG